MLSIGHGQTKLSGGPVVTAPATVYIQVQTLSRLVCIRPIG